MKNLHKPLLFAGIGTTFVILALFWFIFSFPSRSSAAEGAARVQTPPVVGYAPAPEIHIANNGLVLLRSARVAAVNGSTITVSTRWGPVDFTWLVLTDASNFEKRNFGTRFLDRNGNTISLDDLQVGAYVTVTGMLGGTAQAPTLDADAVRSLQ